MLERLVHHPQWAAVPLRLIVGFGFMQHGYAKLVHGPTAFVSILHALGVPAAHVMAWVTILIELLGGFAVFVGAFLPLVSVPLVGILVTAMLSVHLPYGFSSIKLIAVTSAGPQFGPPGYECDLLYLACLAALVLIGAGPFSVDGLLSRKRSRHDDQRSKLISPSADSLRRT
jgi:putative oxidoreductase